MVFGRDCYLANAPLEAERILWSQWSGVREPSTTDNPNALDRGAKDPEDDPRTSLRSRSVMTPLVYAVDIDEAVEVRGRPDDRALASDTSR